MPSSAPAHITHDELLESARAGVARAVGALEAGEAALAIARREAAQLDDAREQPPSRRDAVETALGRPTSAPSWREVPRALKLAEGRQPDLERELRDARVELARLEASRVDVVDDAMTEARRAMAAAAEREASASAEFASAQEAYRQATVAVALGEATQVDVDAAAARVDELEAEGRDAGVERGRQAALLEGLAQRRAQAVRAADAERSAAAAAEWRRLQVDLARAAREYAAAGAGLVRLAERHELLPLADPHATLWSDEDLARIVRRADFLALRD